MSFIIVGDNGSNLPVEVIDHFDLKILPMAFSCEGKEYHSYLKGQEIDLASFYRMMREGKEFITSLISYGDCKNLLDPVIEASDDDLLYIGMSSGISGSFNVVSNYLAEQQEQHPGRRFVAIDTFAASLGEGLLVRRAARLREEGKSLDEVCAWLQETIPHMGNWFTVDDLMFLFRGGRLSRTSALAGTLLDIKPTIHMDDEGKLIPVGKVRNRRKSLAALVDRAETLALRPLDKGMLAVSHADCLQDAEYVADLVCERFEGVTRDDILINVIDPVIGSHSGPGTVALFFLARER